jgi:uncharacterized protein
MRIPAPTNTVGRKTEISNLLARLPRLGVGLSYRSKYHDQLLQHQSNIDFVEVVADDYLFAPADKLDELERLTEHFTVIPHALNLSLGSADGVSDDYLNQIAKLVRQLHPPWWSEHIGYTRAGGIEIGQPAPLPFTREAIDVVARNMVTVRRKIAAPVILENVDHKFELPGGEMPEDEFVSEVLGWGGCGMLLDITSFYAHTVERGRDPYETIRQLPLDRIVQLHVSDAGDPGTKKDPTTDRRDVWKLLEAVIAAAPVRGIVLEQNDNFSSVEGIIDSVAQARELGQRHNRWN